MQIGETVKRSVFNLLVTVKAKGNFACTDSSRELQNEAGISMHLPYSAFSVSPYHIITLATATNWMPLFRIFAANAKSKYNVFKLGQLKLHFIFQGPGPHPHIECEMVMDCKLPSQPVVDPDDVLKADCTYAADQGTASLLNVNEQYNLALFKVKSRIPYLYLGDSNALASSVKRKLNALGYPEVARLDAIETYGSLRNGGGTNRIVTDHEIPEEARGGPILFGDTVMAMAMGREHIPSKTLAAFLDSQRISR